MVRKIGLALLAFVTVPSVAHAQHAFPFTIERDSKGTLTRIELPLRNSILSEGLSGDEDVLTELRLSVREYQSQSMAQSMSLSALEAQAPVPADADDRKTLEEAKAYLKKDFDANVLSDNRLDKEYAKAKTKILQVKLFRLLSAPSTPTAFDTEQNVAETIKLVLGEAGNVLGLASPAYSVFEFLVDQYVEALESRRAFFQNQLLVLLANDSTLFSAKEKSAIRSSIFYSRLEFYDLPARSKARKAWSTYGDDQLAKALKPCKGFAKTGDKTWGSCFKQDGNLIVNRMINKVTLSKDPSLAFDVKNPSRVQDFRVLMMLARLGVKLLPVPSLAKKPVYYWIDSQFVEQRKSEGYVYAYATLRNQTDLANWILTGTANPIIRK
jgi:hypothetical protein